MRVITPASRHPAMPYRRATYTTYKKSYSRKPYTGRKLNLRQKKEVKRLIGSDEELKAIDTSVLLGPDAAGSVIKLTSPPQGDGVSARDGDQIQIKRLRVRLNMIGGDSTNILRVIIFRWAMNDSVAAPTVLDVLQSAGPLSMYQYTSLRQNEFHIVADRTFTFTLNGPNDKLFEAVFYGRRIGKKNVHFNAGLTTGTDQFYLIAISDSVAAPHPSIGGTTRFEYTDS